MLKEILTRNILLTNTDILALDNKTIYIFHMKLNIDLKNWKKQRAKRS